MELITTHLGADFDAFCSMRAALRLHPEARLFFPGSREESVRRMLDAGFAEVEELRHKQVDPAAIERIVLCDIRQRDRLGIVAEWLSEHPGIDVVAYDHHPDSDDDVPASGGIVDPTVGATCTLMVEELRRRGLEVTAHEATLLLMGIYEDTGSLTYPPVAPRDLEAAAWLLGQGGDLEAVRRFALRGLDAERLEILHRMTRALEIHRPRGHRVGTLALELGRYVDELAPLVSRCLEIYELPLLFACFGEGDRVTVIARGDGEVCDVGEVLAEVVDGGGHATAAAAGVRHETAIQVRERLLARLEEVLPPATRARDLMVDRFHSVERDATVGEAKAVLNQRKVNALPVVDSEGRAVGAVSRQLLDSSLQHGLGERSVETVMETDLEWVAPDAAAEELGERILSRHPRFVLVGDPGDGRPDGLVTRMQVLRHLHGRLEEAGQPLARRNRELKRRQQEVGHLLERGLSDELRRRVEAAAAVAREHDLPAYLVGGLVRDLLLERPNRDLDLVVEGDGPHFARLLADRLGARVRVHAAFMTAVIIEPDGFRIDVATARSEFYRAPAALPEVETSALRQDLYRRDFTINTLAIRLGGTKGPQLIDYFGGRRDLKRGVIRVLHSLSFIDDPTRVLRAVRLELRLDFEISPETLRLVRVALDEGVFDHLSGSRLRDELARLLEDPLSVERALERLDELGVLAAIDPGLELDAEARGRVRQALAALDWYQVEGLDEPPVVPWRLFLMALASGLPGGGVERLAERLRLVGDDARVVRGFRRRLRRARRTIARPGVAPHEVVAALRPLAGEETLLLMAVSDESGREQLRRALELRGVELTVGGADLLERGAEPGPAIGRALSRTLEARIDGRIGPGEELDFALRALAADDAEAAGPAGEGG